MRTIALQYMRALGHTNPQMESYEKMCLVRSMIFEGMQRAKMSIEDDKADIFYISVF